MKTLHSRKNINRNHFEWYGNTSYENLKRRSPFNASAFWAIVFSVLTPLLFSSCVHEFPSDDCNQRFILNLEFDTEWRTRNYDYTRASNEPTYMTYIVHAYPMYDGNINEDNYETFTFTQEVNFNYDCSLPVDLAPGDYRILVWSEFSDKEGYSLYYNSSDFARVEVDANPYTGDTDLRDAFYGEIEVNLDAHGNEALETAVIEMNRPLAKYRFIATDLQDFIESESAINAGGKVNLEDYYVVVNYPQYMPSAFNMFTSKPTDSLLGISFRSELTSFDQSLDISMGFDYVFVNGTESSVMVQMAVYAKEDDRLIARTPQIRVPLLRSVETLVKGAFLHKPTGDSDEGVGIDPGYDGDFVIVAPLVPEQ